MAPEPSPPRTPQAVVHRQRIHSRRPALGRRVRRCGSGPDSPLCKRHRNHLRAIDQRDRRHPARVPRRPVRRESRAPANRRIQPVEERLVGHLPGFRHYRKEDSDRLDIGDRRVRATQRRDVVHRGRARGHRHERRAPDLPRCHGQRRQWRSCGLVDLRHRPDRNVPGGLGRWAAQQERRVHGCRRRRPKAHSRRDLSIPTVGRRRGSAGLRSVRDRRHRGIQRLSRRLVVDREPLHRRGDADGLHRPNCCRGGERRQVVHVHGRGCKRGPHPAAGAHRQRRRSRRARRLPSRSGDSAGLEPVRISPRVDRNVRGLGTGEYQHERPHQSRPRRHVRRRRSGEGRRCVLDRTRGQVYGDRCAAKRSLAPKKGQTACS